MTDDPAIAFEAARPKLMGIAYRMLGSVVEAEDVVGDVAERWLAADRDDVRIAEAWLVTTTTRRALDVLRSARLQRESYIGVWLPEPLATSNIPGDDVERVESLAVGFLLLLERLTPIERAVFVLHDALDYSYEEVADAVGRTEAACRQALHRAREHVSLPKPRKAADRMQAEAVAQQFMLAGLTGDLDALMATMAPDVVLTSDGGGVVYAAIRPVLGVERVARFMQNLISRHVDDPFIVARELNGLPGAIMHIGDRWATIAVETNNAAVTAIRLVVNPAKLERLVGSIPEAAGRTGPWASTDRFRHRQGRAIT